MFPQWPKEDVKWRQRVEQLLTQFDVDIKRLWRRTPQAFRHTDGDELPAEFPIQEVPEPITGSATGIGTVNTANTGGTLSAPCGPCGACLWSWNEVGSSWVLVGNSCAAGCNPVYPVVPGSYAGQTTVTCCTESISGTPGSGSLPTGCDCGLTTYEWNGTNWLVVDSTCTAGCVDALPPGDDGTFTGEQRVLCCIDGSGTPDTGDSLSGTPLSGTPDPLSGTPDSGVNTGASDGSSGVNTGASTGYSGSVGLSGSPLSGTPLSGRPFSGTNDCGTCVWEWDGMAWLQVENLCTGGCSCVAPNIVGTTVGQQERTNCAV